MIYVPDGHGGLTEVCRASAPRIPADAPASGSRAWACTPLRAVVPRDSREVLPLRVTHGGQPVVDGVTVDIGGRTHTLAADGVLVDHLPPGAHTVKVKHTSGAVIDGGRVVVT